VNFARNSPVLFRPAQGYGTERHLIKLHEHGPCQSIADLSSRWRSRSRSKEHLSTCSSARVEKLACSSSTPEHKILYRNFRARHGEVDIVCRDGDTLVFIRKDP
jgi:hypothetical protein